MRAILEFSLPEEETEHRAAVDGSNWKTAMFEFDRKLRSIEKHGEDSEAAAKYREMLREVMDENGVAFD